MRGEMIVGMVILFLMVISHRHDDVYAAKPETAPEPAPLTLPEVCRPYYNDGTDRWKDCIGVGLK